MAIWIDEWVLKLSLMSNVWENAKKDNRIPEIFCIRTLYFSIYYSICWRVYVFNVHPDQEKGIPNRYLMRMVIWFIENSNFRIGKIQPLNEADIKFTRVICFTHSCLTASCRITRNFTQLWREQYGVTSAFGAVIELSCAL